jgi:molecular chaperone GrpE
MNEETEPKEPQAGSEASNEPSQGGNAAEPGGEASLEIERLRQDLEAERQRCAEYRDNWQRARADFANLRKRTEQEKEEVRKYGTAELLAHLLVIEDDFERAFVALPPSLHHFTWIDGMVVIYQKLMAILEHEGLTPIEAAGKDFDPSVHEAVQIEEGAEGQIEVVTAELQRGYKLNDRVLRPALVKVGKRQAT